MVTTDKLIIVQRETIDDAAAIAARAAYQAGTSLDGNLRWYGGSGPAYREQPTQDGRTVRVLEPKVGD